MAGELARALNDAAVALRDVAADLLDLKAAIERRSLSDPAEERGPTRVEPLRPENPDEEAPIARDCSAPKGRPDDPLDFTWSQESPTKEQWDAGRRYGICWVPA